ncbi:MAG: hypothetical protein IJH47_00920 [Oscillospiraceae bacterium]|nr:hypothetical protein [Oscillospiraceae bacterium]
MNRTARDRTGDHPAPVERIELNEDKLRLRFILAVVFLAVGLGALFYALTRLLTPDTGWQEIQTSRGGYSVGSDFVFYYDLGAGGGSPTAEKKKLTVLYTQAAAEAYQIFDAHQRYEGVGNLASLSDAPNETVTVDPGLYRALEKLERSGRRELYLAPVYEMYYSLFHCQELSETEDFDPFRNRDLADWCREAAAFAADPEAVSLEFPGEDRVCLRVSEEYLAFLREYGITDFLDFFWMRNAFVTDYLADALTGAGFTRGCLSSRDGFVRDLDGSGTAFDLNLFHRTADGKVYPAGVMTYRGPASLVSLYAYPVAAERNDWYYAMPDGTVRHPFVDVSDGLCRTSVPELTAYSSEGGCADVLLRVLGIFLSDTLDGDALADLAGQGVYTVRCEDGVILHTDPAAEFSALYAGDDVVFRAEQAGR